VAFLEGHVGVQLLHCATRLIKLSEAGERYAASCRRMLTDLQEADMLAAGERSAPRGTLTLTAPAELEEELEVTQRLVEAAHHVCRYSRATRGNIDVATNLV
jgi:DNA-binding transcriptional LysR family regulator